MVKPASLEIALAEENARVLALEEQLRIANDQIQQAVEGRSLAELETQKSREALARYEDSLADLEASLDSREKKVKDATEELNILQAALVVESRKARQEMRESVLDLLAQRKLAYERHRARRTRWDLLISPVGQEFLRIMHQDMLAEFVKSNDFAAAALGGFGALVGKTIRIVCEQMKVTPEKEAMLDTDSIGGLMDRGLVNKELGIDPDLRPDWWILVMERALRY